MVQVPMKAHVCFWVAVLLSAVEGIADCPDDYRMHEKICYKAFDDDEDFLSASETCVDEGGTLAMPKDPRTNAFVISLKTYVDSNRLFRFGLVDQHQQGNWEWIDGTPIGNYSAWGQGIPDSQSQEDGEEYCAEYSSTGWNVERCSEDRGFICQIILAGCPEEYVYHEPSEMCYKAYDHRENYNGAVATCFIDGGTLATPRDAVTNKFLIYLKNAVDNTRSFRFGLTYIQQEGIWMWADNVTLGSFSAWGSGEPNNYNGRDEDCAEYFSGNGDRKNTWNDGQCSWDRRFICQAIPTGCPSGYRMHEKICYKAFNRGNTFLEASKICVDEDGTLAMPKDPSTDAFLVVLKNYVDSSRLFRFGLVDQYQEGDWEWIDGTPIGNYSAWGQGKPNNQGDDDCAEYSTTTWKDEGCSENRRFICQVIPAGCPEGYVYHEPSRVCYKAFNEETNYHDAVATCSSDGGTLAMPRDAATNKFLIYLKNAVDNNAWFRFGLTYIQQEQTWMWADNVTLGNFSAWGSGEPNNYNGRDEDCAEYFRGNHGDENKRNTWNDGPCSGDDRKFICQVTPTDDSTTAPSVEIPSSSSPPSSPSASSSASPSPSSPPSSPPSASPTSPSVGTEMPWPSSTDSVVLAEVNVSLTLTVPGPVNSVNRSSLRDSIRQSLEMKVGDFCEDHCKIGEIFLHITDTNPARKKRQAADDEVQINVIIQLIVLANQGQGTTNATEAAESLLKEKAEALRNLTRNGDLSITLNGKEIHLAIVDSSNNCPSGEARNNDGMCDKESKSPSWLIGVICTIVVAVTVIAVVTVLLYRRTHNPGANIPGKSGNEMTNLDAPKRRDHPATDGSVDNIIYNTEDEGVVDNVIYNAGDDGTVDNVIYEGQDSQTNDRENAPESQYETIN